MSERTISRDVQAKASVRSQPDAKSLGTSPRTSEFPAFGLQQTLGNQAMLQLLESGTIQAKLRLSQPGDPDEVEADSVAEKVVAKSRAPVIHRKCACGGGSPCPKCAGAKEEETIYRSAATPQLHSLEPTIQRAPADPTSTADAMPATPDKQPPGAKTSGTLIVEDNAAKVEPYQMHKSQFIALLRTEACAAADAALASVKHTTKGCPYVAKWLSFYEKQSSEHIERTIRKYAPEAAKARSAREAIGLLVARVEQAAITWAKTGKVEGVPKELASEFPGQGGFLGAVNSIVSSKVGGAILGFIGGTKKHEGSDHAQVQRKAQNTEAAPAHDAATVKTQLGNGHSLDSRVQSQMSVALGYDFSGVQVHTDSQAAVMSDQLNARAFTVGDHIAFGTGQYQPGTIVGDALLAHELAHVVQQGGVLARSVFPHTSENQENALERDADGAAMGAMASLLGKGRGVMARGFAMPRLRSGLALRRCSKDTAGPAAAGPKLKKTTVAGPSDIDCGGFKWGAQWSIENPGGTNGFVVQHVEVAFDVKDCANNPVDVKAKSGVDPASWPIWEAWQVRNGSVFVGTSTSPHQADTYGMPAMGDSTKGSIKIIGSADYYPNLTLPVSFAATNKAPAWALPVTTTDPSLSGGTGVLAHNLTATWNCCPDGKDKKTKLSTT